MDIIELELWKPNVNSPGCLERVSQRSGVEVFEELKQRLDGMGLQSSEKNRFQNAFTVCNVALDSVVSDMFGKSATAITDYLTSDEPLDPLHCVWSNRIRSRNSSFALRHFRNYGLPDYMYKNINDCV